MKWIRHGDVIIEQITTLPKGVKLEKTTNPVLAEGEVTGHFHRLQSPCLFAQHGDEKFFRIDREILLTHEEHDTLKIPKGTYRVRLQREVDLLGEVRTVLD